MSQTTRRKFLANSRGAALSLAAGWTILADPRSASATPANDRVILAMIGVRGRGNSLAQGFLDRDDCRLGYVCDVDRSTAEGRAAEYAKRQEIKPQIALDFREALEDKSVDATIVATPDHWHAPAAVWSCQAGKDVYVEKPPTHNCWEGQKLIEAAEKYECIVQVGTQNRSAPYNMSARKYITDGKLGRIHLCRVFNMKQQGNFKLAADSAVPDGFNWDMWNGPAPERPYNSSIRYGNWHHLWNYSGGDAGNDGVHQLDLARWLIGVEVPGKVSCTGGRFDSEGAAETPDTQIASYTFDNLVMTFELTLYTPYMLKTDGEIRENDMYPYWPQNATRIEIYGSQGVMTVGRHGGGWQVHVRPKSRQPVVAEEAYGRFPDPEHKENFLACVRSRNKPNADPVVGHRSALLVHYANMSYRLGGRQLVIDPATEHVVDDAAAMELFKRSYRKPWEISEVV
jgi:predicted dehydrogenase